MNNGEKYKCEICHRFPAKKVYFDEDNHELYICQRCFNKRTVDYFTEVLKTINDRDEVDIVGKKISHKKMLDELMILTVECLLTVRSKLKNKPDHFFAERHCLQPDGSLVQAKINVDMDKDNKEVTLSSFIGDNHPGTTKWTFNINSPLKPKLTVVYHTGNKNTDFEQRQTFRDYDVPKPLWNFMQLLTQALTDSIDEIETRD